ncbi:MAG: enoyl-ACP reductase, partial [Myxococcota bacterium]
MSDFLGLEGKTFVVFGVANKKSVGFHAGRVLADNGANVVYVVHTDARRDALKKRLPDSPIFV